MIFLEAAGNLEGEDDLEILEEVPLRTIVPLPPLDKGKGMSYMVGKRKGSGGATNSEKLMADAQRTRSSKRLARREGDAGPDWKLAKDTMLLTPDERIEWVQNVLPVGTKSRFKIGHETERKDRVNSALIVMFGAVGQICENVSMLKRAEQNMNEEARHYEDKYKEANEVLKLRNTEKMALLQEKEEIERARKVLVQQVQEISQEKEELEERVNKITEVNEFWCERGAEKMVGTCLKSPELYQWLLQFGGTILNIGKTQGAAIVFTKYEENTEYWKEKKVEDVPGCARGGRYARTYIDNKIKMLQAGRVKFQFFEYLAANPGLDCHELENLGYYAYRTLADRTVASSSTATMAAAAGIDFEDQGKERPVWMETDEQAGPRAEEEVEGSIEET